MLDPIFERIQVGANSLRKKIIFGCSLIFAMLAAGAIALFVHSVVICVILIVVVCGGIIPVYAYLRADKDPNEP